MTRKDKENVIAALEEYKGDSTGLIAATIEDCQRVVREMEENDGWISVTERLPKRSGEYLAFTESGLQAQLQYSAVHRAFNCLDWFSSWFALKSCVQCTHWRNLPEPPKEET